MKICLRWKKSGNEAVHPNVVWCAEAGVAWLMDLTRHLFLVSLSVSPDDDAGDLVNSSENEEIQNCADL